MVIFPAIDMLGGRCVRLFQGDYAKETVYNQDPGDQAGKWEAAGAEFLHVVDLDGAKAGHPVNTSALKAICDTLHIPCEIGGGIRTLDDARKVFDLGVSRVILGTVACENPQIAEDFIRAFGQEKVVVGIDAKNGLVAVRGWIETSKVDAFTLAQDLCRRGVNRIIFTDIATDGALSGPNLKSVKSLCQLLPDCHVIASGGVSCAADVTRLVELAQPNLEGVIVGKALYDGRADFASLNAEAKKGQF